jgi:TonB family protein
LEGFYIAAWVRKVEQIGEMNFPEIARRLNLNTGPVLDVAIRADGSLREVRVVRSSGYAELDQAAQRIVKLGAPYAPFPPSLRQKYDVLQIARPWRFDPGGQVRARWVKGGRVRSESRRWCSASLDEVAANADFDHGELQGQDLPLFRGDATGREDRGRSAESSLVFWERILKVLQYLDDRMARGVASCFNFSQSAWISYPFVMVAHLMPCVMSGLSVEVRDFMIKIEC